ncbi:MAG: hemolysin-type calcium binding protein, partial [Myxococcaceae bacterium]|nr:hemolysin-type calcium binding protein [Myxococcaceae bacterium]
SEVCGNGIDDDCDGQADATDSNCWVCTPGQTQSCSTSCSGGGTRRCTPAGQWETTCRPPSESCDNGVDDDCDGKVDHHDFDCPEIIHTCEDAEGGGCNGDMGYGDHCSAANNTGGCSAGRFWAWCNRRNTAYPDIWDNWVRNWVSSRCDGTTSETGTQYSTWYCSASSNDRYECTTPLVLSFDGAPVGLAAPNASFAFAPGQAVYSSWPRPATPWLVRDLDRNGRIDDGTELFGSNTRLPDGSLATHGFAALAALDENHDGVVDRADLAFGSLRLWSDLDGDRRTDPGELRTLPAAGVTSLGLGFTVEPRCDRDGNCERERAAFSWTDKAGRRHTGAVVDVYLATAPDPRLSCLER